MIAAFPEWESRISPLFDTARRILIVEILDKEERSRKELSVENLPQALKIRALVDSRVDVLVCNAISKPALYAADSAGLTVYPWNAGYIDDIIESLSEQKKPDSRFSIPACPGRGLGRCGGRGRRQRGKWSNQ